MKSGKIRLKLSHDLIGKTENIPKEPVIEFNNHALELKVELIDVGNFRIFCSIV